MGFHSLEYYGEEVTAENIASIIWDEQTTEIGWLFWWDEAKAIVAQLLAMYGDYDFIASPIGWPNAWHTIITESGEKFVWRNLPGSAITGKDVFLGQDKYINVKLMEQELLRLKELWVEPNIKIAEWSHALFTSFHGRMDWAIEDAKKENGNNIGTTKSGMWPWVATRWLRNGITLEKLHKMSRSDISIAVKELTAPFNSDFIWNLEDIESEIVEQQSILNRLIDQWNTEIVDSMFAREAFHKWMKWLIEAAQSKNLGMHGGSYPNNTPTHTHFSWAMWSLEIPPIPWRTGKVGVLKTISSKVGIHDFPEQISNIFPELLEQEEAFAAATWEYWSMSGRMRQLWFLDIARLANDVKYNPYITSISLRKMDVLKQFKEILWFDEFPVVTDYDKSWKPKLTMLPYDDKILIDTIKKKIDEIAWGKKWTNMPFILWYGRKASESTVVLPDA